ncbi:MAG: hypothetical protein RLZZ297_1571 [Chloroflexota bacterium]|jgi:2,4-dienoyl-CoA reductase-like NADH-dependent reductase (Old Yellow Enzyme family)
MAAQLFTPVSIGPLTLPNRIVVAPMCTYSANDGVMSDWHMVHYAGMATATPGMVVIEATGVERIGRITHGCLGLYSDAAMRAMADVIRMAKVIAPQTRFGVQIGHAGRKASYAHPTEPSRQLPADAGGWQVVGPSAIPYDTGWQVPRELDDAGITRVIAAFQSAAQRAVQAGVDSVELHMAHGYLLQSFISPLSNRRTDAWGGDLRGRMALPLAVVRAVQAVLPAHIAFGARINGTDWHADGLSADDAVGQAQLLRDAGLHFVCVSSGGNTPHAQVKAAPKYQVPIAARVKREVGITTRTVGLINDPHVAEAIIADGEADMVALGRAFLDDPRWPWRAAEALGEQGVYPFQYERSAAKHWPLKSR